MGRGDRKGSDRRDNAASARVSERRKVLGDHEQHEVQRLTRQHSSGTPRARRERRSAAESNPVQTFCSFLAVGLVFVAFMYWAIILLMPTDD